MDLQRLRESEPGHAVDIVSPPMTLMGADVINCDFVLQLVTTRALYQGTTYRLRKNSTEVPKGRLSTISAACLAAEDER